MKKQFSCAARLAVVCAAFTLLAGVVRAGGEETALSGVAEGFLPPILEGKEWKQAWSDEFDGAKVDESKWEIMGDLKRRDGYWVKEVSYTDG